MPPFNPLHQALWQTSPCSGSLYVNKQTEGLMRVSLGGMGWWRNTNAGVRQKEDRTLA